MENFESQVQIPDQLISELEKANFPIYEDFLTQLSKAAELADNPSPAHPFYQVKLQSYSVETREQIQKSGLEFIDQRSKYLSVLIPIVEELGIQKIIRVKERAELEKLLALSVGLSQLPQPLFFHIPIPKLWLKKFFL